MRIFITGGAGFIGSHFVDRLVNDHEVVVLDNFSLGKREFIEQHRDNRRLILVKADLLDLRAVEKWTKKCDIVFHLAANSDIRKGIQMTDADLKQGTLVTYHVLEAMRRNGVKKIVFASSSVVYGLANKIPTPEDYGPLLPISLYGASKLACEGLISSFSHTFGVQAWIFRFANIVGARMTHGVIPDFYKKLKRNPKKLEILGDGKQKKTYLHVNDCINGILFAMEHAREPVNLLNLSSDDMISVTEIARVLVKKMGLTDTRFEFTGTAQGWRGDVPQMGLETKKLKKLGWEPCLNSSQAIEKAIEEFVGCRQSSLLGV